jgi:hypothetical protein
VWGSGSQYRDFVFVDDIVKALLLVKDKGMNKGVIQLGSKHATTIFDLAKDIGDIVGKHTGQEISLEFDTCQPEGDRGRIAAGDRAEQILGWKATVPLRRGLEVTVDWMRSRGNQTTVLVIVAGRPEGRNDWQSILSHLARPSNTHLATFSRDSSPQTMLQQEVQYNWTFPEVQDWGLIFDQATQLCEKDGDPQEWRSLCALKDQKWTGISKDCDRSATTANALLALQWLVAQKLLSLHLLGQYDYFVMMGADFIYRYDKKAVSNLDPHTGYASLGKKSEEYTGSQIFGSSEMFFKMINVTQQLVCNVEHYKQVESKANTQGDLNSAQRMVWKDLQIPVEELDRHLST